MNQPQQYKKITFNFPAEEFVYLKMACAKQGISMKDFLTKAVIKTIEDYEDQLDIEALKRSREEKEPSIPWKEAEKTLGWDTL